MRVLLLQSQFGTLPVSSAYLELLILKCMVNKRKKPKMVVLSEPLHKVFFFTKHPFLQTACNVLYFFLRYMYLKYPKTKLLNSCYTSCKTENSINISIFRKAEFFPVPCLRRREAGQWGVSSWDVSSVFIRLTVVPGSLFLIRRNRWGRNLLEAAAEARKAAQPKMGTDALGQKDWGEGVERKRTDKRGKCWCGVFWGRS